MSTRTFRMGLVWVKLWKLTEVASKAALVAMVQWAARNLAVAQWAGLMSRHGVMGRSKVGKPGYLHHAVLACGRYLDEFRRQ